MKLKFLRLLSASFLLALTLIFAFGQVVSAAPVATPDLAYSLSVEVYRDCIETGDQLYLIVYNIDYTANPTDGASNQLFLCRLMNGAVELGSTTPYPYFDSGYDYGVMSIYFNAADAPTWNGDYTMTVVGNPLYTWVAGDPPSSSAHPLTYWYDGSSVAATQTTLSNRIKALALLIELDWGGTHDLVEGSPGNQSLTEEGEEYFNLTIPNVMYMAPSAFGATMTQPSIEDRTYSQTYSNTLKNRLSGTQFDFTNLAWNIMPGLSALWVSTAVWYILITAPIAIVVSNRFQSYRLVPVIVAMMTPLGALAGFVPLLWAIVLTFGFAAVSIFIFSYRGTS